MIGDMEGEDFVRLGLKLVISIVVGGICTAVNGEADAFFQETFIQTALNHWMEYLIQDL